MTPTDPPRAEMAASPGWYTDPWGVAPFRWWDGREWTARVASTGSSAPPSNLGPTVPRTRAEWFGFCVAALVGLALWIPTMAMHPLYSDSPHEDLGSPLLVPLLFVAALVLGAIFAREWQVIAGGLVSFPLVLALFTTPRGDNDGLWVLIIPMLVVLGAGMHGLAGASGLTVNWLVKRCHRDATGATDEP